MGKKTGFLSLLLKILSFLTFVLIDFLKGFIMPIFFIFDIL